MQGPAARSVGQITTEIRNIEHGLGWHLSRCSIQLGLVRTEEQWKQLRQISSIVTFIKGSIDRVQCNNMNLLKWETLLVVPGYPGGVSPENINFSPHRR